MVFLCDYTGYVRPEIIKARPVVVVSPRRHRMVLADVTTLVVPLSKLPPQVAQPWHIAIPPGKYAAIDACWAKGDLVSHVALARLSFLRHRRRLVVPVLDRRDLQSVRNAVANALGLLTSARRVG